MHNFKAKDCVPFNCATLHNLPKYSIITNDHNPSDQMCLDT